MANQAGSVLASLKNRMQSLKEEADVANEKREEMYRKLEEEREARQAVGVVIIFLISGYWYFQFKLNCINVHVL